jgi:transcriptional regulator with XRE-family HTH domain
MKDVISNREIGERLELLRVSKGIPTQRDMAQLLGVDTNRYNNWAIGTSRVPVNYAVMVCVLTGATLDYIYRGEVSGLSINLITLLDDLSRRRFGAPAARSS